MLGSTIFVVEGLSSDLCVGVRFVLLACSGDFIGTISSSLTSIISLSLVSSRILSAVMTSDIEELATAFDGVVDSL